MFAAKMLILECLKRGCKDDSNSTPPFGAAFLHHLEAGNIASGERRAWLQHVRAFSCGMCCEGTLIWRVAGMWQHTSKSAEMSSVPAYNRIP